MNNELKQKIETLEEKLSHSKYCDNLDMEYFLLNKVSDETTFDNVIEYINTIIQEDSEVIYYGNAMEFLKNNDISLQDSLNLAAEYGYNLSNLNSEKLASLLNYDLMITEFNEIITELD